MTTIEATDFIGELGQPFHPSRRWFVGAGAAGAVLAATQVSVPLSAPTAASARAFAVHAVEGVNVLVGTGAHFTMIVLDADRRVLERHDRVSSARVLDLRSEYFTVEAVDPPTD